MDKMCVQFRGTSLALVANSNNHKITFLLSPSHTKGQVFFPPSAPSSLFLLPSAAHNSEHYDGCPQAMEWIQDRTAPPTFLLNIALVSTV